jgi:hypothetical protein
MGRREFTQQYPINTRTIDQRDIRAYESMTIATSPPFYSRYEKKPHGMSSSWNRGKEECSGSGQGPGQVEGGRGGHVKLKLARI